MVMWQRKRRAHGLQSGPVTGATLMLALWVLSLWVPVLSTNAEAAPVAATAQDGQTAPSGTVAERLARLERIVNSQGLVDMQVRLDRLQQDVQDLRGQIEVQNHQLVELKRRQRDLYVDIDRRLSQLERANASSSGGAGASTGASASSSAAASASAPATTAHAAPASPPARSAGAQGPASSAKEQQAYQVAFDLLRELRYDQAIKAFHAFLKDYPHGRYAHIAQYWVAEANYAQRRFKDAIADYQNLLDDYPNSPKRAEAMLKIGYSYYELGDIKRARESLGNLVSAYPNTTEAGQAQNLLQKLRVQGSKS